MPTMLLAFRAPDGWTLSVTLLDDDGTMERSWVREHVPDGAISDGDVATEWASRGRHTLRILGVATGHAPIDVRVPVELVGTEAAVLVVLDEWRDVEVSVLERAEVALTVTDTSPLELLITNHTEDTVEGMGSPMGMFDGELLQLSPRRHWVRRSRRHCGTALADGSLEPGESTFSGPSHAAMYETEVRRPEPGEYVWLVPLETDAVRRVESRQGDVDVALVHRPSAQTQLVID